jgi:hypothetical protein
MNFGECLPAFGPELPLPRCCVKIKVYRSIISAVVSCKYETWSVTLREEHRLRVFDNGVLRMTFGSKRDELIRKWIKLHSEELYDFYSSPNIFRVIK